MESGKASVEEERARRVRWEEEIGRKIARMQAELKVMKQIVGWEGLDEDDNNNATTEGSEYTGTPGKRTRDSDESEGVRKKKWRGLRGTERESREEKEDTTETDERSTTGESSVCEPQSPHTPGGSPLPLEEAEGSTPSSSGPGEGKSRTGGVIYYWVGYGRGANVPGMDEIKAVLSEAAGGKWGSEEISPWWVEGGNVGWKARMRTTEETERWRVKKERVARRWGWRVEEWKERS